MKATKGRNSSRKAEITKFQINWNNKYFQLKDFKKHNGHCAVPQQWIKNPSLGRWVIRQRVYKKTLAQERIELLDKIGFIWNTYDATWRKTIINCICTKKNSDIVMFPKDKQNIYSLLIGLQNNAKTRNTKNPV